MPARLFVKVTGLKGSGSGAGVASCMEMVLGRRLLFGLDMEG